VEIVDSMFQSRIVGMNVQAGERLRSWLQAMENPSSRGSEGNIAGFKLTRVDLTDDVWEIEVRFRPGRGITIEEIQSNVKRFAREFPTELALVPEHVGASLHAGFRHEMDELLHGGSYSDGPTPRTYP